MLDIVQILRRNRFFVFAENARREVLQSPSLCLPGFADRPAEGVRIRCHCHSLNTRNSVTAGGIRVKKSLVVEVCDRRLDPKGLLNPDLYAGTVHLLYRIRAAPAGRDLGCGREQDWPKEAAKTAVVAFAVVWN